MILLKQMAVLFLLMIVGFACRKLGLLNDESSKKLSGLVVNVANPALILSAGINPEDPLNGTELLKIFGLAILIYAAVIVVAVVLPLLLHTPKKDRGLYQVMMIFSNIGFMGFPLISAVYGSDALVMATAFLVPYNVLIYTIGIRLMAPKEKSANANDAAPDGALSIGQVLKNIFNVGVIACILSLICYMTRLPVPSVLADTVDYLSSLTAPLSMLIIGDSMTKIKVKELASDWRLLVFTAVNLLLVPIVAVQLLKLGGVSGDLLGVCMIMLATPVGSMTVMLAQQYGGDYELASKGVALTTVLSVATIPLVSMFV